MVNNIEEQEAKNKIKKELNIESFGTINEKDIAKACQYVETKTNYG